MPTIDDFLVLKYSDAVITGTSAVWNIPPNYYSNQRSSVCFMSLERCNIIFRGNPGQDDSANVATMIRVNLNAQNQQLTDNNETLLDIVKTDTKAVITNYATTTGSMTTTTNVMTEVRNCCVKFDNPNPMRLLVSARPTTIKITIQNRDFTTFNSNPDPVILLDENYVVLRFEYDDIKDTQREYKQQFTRVF